MKHIGKIAAIFAAGVALFACAPVKILNTITPSGSFEKMEDVAFGDHPRLKLDIYQPTKPLNGAPVLMFVHGGSWSDGSKDLYKFVGEAFTSEGLTVVVPNYRLYPGINFPDPITDTVKAAAFTANRYHGRPLILMGHSAGAYNILMAALDPQYLAAEGIDICTRVSGVISLSGPTGVTPLKEEPYITIFPDRFTGKDAPLGNTDKTVPPLFLMNGEDDKTVYPQNAEALAEKIIARGGNAKAHLYPGLNHTDAVKVLSRYFDGDSTLKADIMSFINAAKIDGPFCQ